MMSLLSKPENGWTAFICGSHRHELSNMSDIPIDWLDAAIKGLKSKDPFTVKGFMESSVFYCHVESERCRIVCLSEHDSQNSQKETTESETIDLSMKWFAFILCQDIATYLDAWVNCFCPNANAEDLEQRKKELQDKVINLSTLLDQYDYDWFKIKDDFSWGSSDFKIYPVPESFSFAILPDEKILRYGIGIEEDSMTPLMYFLNKYYDKEIPNNGDCWAGSGSDKFDWYGINQYTVKDIYMMLDEMVEMEKKLSTDFYNPELAELRKSLTHTYGIGASYFWMPEEMKEQCVKRGLPLIFDFYHHFSQKIRRMIENTPGTARIAFEGP